MAVGNVVVQLIPGENHKVWILVIQDLSNEVYRKWVSLALWQIFPMCINSIFAYPDPSDHVHVRDLNNLEFSILPYSQRRPSIWSPIDPAVEYAKSCNRYLWPTVKLERSSHKSPLWSWVNGIRTKKNVHFCYSLVNFSRELAS